MNRLLTWLGETFAARKKLIINDECGGRPYMTRYYMLGHRTSDFAIMLHHIHRSDISRDLHDHPWPFISLILTGGYWEVTPLQNWGTFRKMRWYRPLSILYRPAKHIHCIRLATNKGPVWTLVLRFSRGREWGFHTASGWVPFDKYDHKAGCE